MAYPIAAKLVYPLKKYKLNGLGFKAKVTSGRILGIHLGEDIVAPAGTEVNCIGNGEVVYAALHPGSPSKGNWGNIVIVSHRRPKSKDIFYSLYAHLEKLQLKEGDKVKIGQTIGIVGTANTPQNGWWSSHLHFAIYVGPWNGIVLPGYFRENQNRTKLEYWRKPSEFIKFYSNK